MKIKSLGLLIALGTLVTYLLVGTFISVITVRNAVSEATRSLNDTVSTLVADAVTEPLKLGSFVDARARLQAFVKRGYFECAELTYDMLPISQCDQPRQDLKPLSVTLALSSDPNFRNPVLTIYFSESKLKDSAFQRSLGVIAFVFGFGFLFMILILFLVRFINNEIQSVSDEFSGKSAHSSKVSSIEEFNFLREKIQEYISLKESEMSSKVLMAASKQVAHDIRAPLTVLEIALNSMVDVSNETRDLLHQANARIRSIAEDLLAKTQSQYFEKQIRNYADDNRIQKSSDNQFDVAASICSIVREYSSHIKDVRFETSGIANQLLVIGHKSDFERAISNLVQNAVDALKGNEEPTLKIALRSSESKAQVTIIDNGCGISEEILARVGEEGFTIGKSGGHGLGVSFAKRKIQSWGGDFHINSKFGSGTMVTLNFRRPDRRISALTSI